MRARCRLRDRAVDAVVAAFSLNHLEDPVAGLQEAARSPAPGGVLLASAYAEDDAHPVKDAAEAAAREHGLGTPAVVCPCCAANAIPKLATVERAQAALADAGLTGNVRAVRIAFPELGAEQLVAWRFGMAQLAPFVATLTADARAAMMRRARRCWTTSNSSVRSSSSWRRRNSPLCRGPLGP